MAVLPMRILPDPILRQRAKPVKVIDTSIHLLIDNMIETMRTAGGVGLAANQVGFLHRVIVIEIPDEEKVRILINPEITHRYGEREVEEGCLSIPGYRGTVKRSENVRAKGLDQDGVPVRIKAEGLLAQALEHETDHLNGILYIDHLVNKDSLRKLPEDEPTEVSVGTR